MIELADFKNIQEATEIENNRASLRQQIEDVQFSIIEEIRLYEWFTNERIALEKQLTDVTKAEIAERIAEAKAYEDQLRDALAIARELGIAQSEAAIQATSGGATVTNNTVNNVTIQPTTASAGQAAVNTSINLPNQW